MLLVLARELYTFQLLINSESKECLKSVKILPDPLSHNIHYKMTGLFRRVLRRKNMSSSKMLY